MKIVEPCRSKTPATLLCKKRLKDSGNVSFSYLWVVHYLYVVRRSLNIWSHTKNYTAILPDHPDHFNMRFRVLSKGSQLTILYSMIVEREIATHHLIEQPSSRRRLWFNVSSRSGRRRAAACGQIGTTLIGRQARYTLHLSYIEVVRFPECSAAYHALITRSILVSPRVRLLEQRNTLPEGVPHKVSADAGVPCERSCTWMIKY